MDFTGKIALITGASRGLGKAIAMTLASYGCNVLINYCNSEKEAIQLATYLEATYSIKAKYYQADISVLEDVVSLVQYAIDEMGTIDILVNNAGIALDTTIDNKKVCDFVRTLDVNSIGTFLMCREVGKIMKQRKYGKIINISSTNGIDTYYPFSVDYDASKAGVISLTHNFALEYAPYVNVNCVAPGWINTDMNKELSDIFKKEEEEKIYLKRFAEAKEVASVVAFLASDLASYINNEVIRVDGGCNHE